jgi:DNA primase
VVATFGAKITDEQIALMRDFPEVLLWMDPDSAGYSAERKVRRELMRYTNVKVVVPEEGMDLGDYNDVEIVRGMLESATPARMRLMEEARNG